MTDLRALITEMADELDHNRQCLLDDRRLTHPLADKACAALAEPEQKGPTDEEIMELMPQQMLDDLAAAARALAGFDPSNIKAASVFRIIFNRHCVDHARAVLARWGNHPGSPDNSMPQPVSVSERLPGPKDCDAEGRCWWAEPQIEDSHDATWNLCTQEDAEEFLTWGTKYGWLPAHALPLPS